jgi:hypothetical protein
MSPNVEGEALPYWHPYVGAFIGDHKYNIL